MFAIAVGVFVGGYWLFHYGYYFAKGAPISMLDDILPSRRGTFLAAIDYMRQQGPFATSNTGVAAAPPPASSSAAPGIAGPAGPIRQPGSG